MKPCKHRHDITAADCGCSNFDDLIHSGRVSLAFCERCPYVMAPATDYFSATSQIYTRDQRAGKIKAMPKPCGGCGGSKAAKIEAAAVPAERRQPAADDSLQFVWVYWHAGAALDELRWSIRSVLKNYAGRARITIIGSNAPWWNGHHIPQKRKTRGSGFQCGLSDMLAKMETVSRHPDIDSEFVWMMDDVYMIRETTREQLMTPRAGGRIQPGGTNNWSVIKAETAARLEAMGLPSRDFATHLPHYVEKPKLAELFRTWDPLNDWFLWEVAYGNTFEDPAAVASHRPFLRRIRRPATVAEYDRWAAESHFFNLCDEAWFPGMRDWLADQFSEPLPAEVGIEWAKGVA